jgi:hypothetical protein
MIPQLRRAERRGAPQQPGHEQRELTLEQVAGAEARRILRTGGLEDSTPIWRALKAAFIAGVKAGRR